MTPPSDRFERDFETWSKREYSEIKPGLDRIRGFFLRAGIDPSALRIIHVAGTNAKGSVCAYTAGILRAAGLKVGLYTSPHLVSVEERINFAGRAISRRELDVLAARFSGAIEKSRLTFFEMMTAIAIVHFLSRGADIAVMEVGVGGKYDATNICDNKALSFVTTVARDHTDLFGVRLKDIISEDIGVISPSPAVVVGKIPRRLFADVLEAAAAAGGEAHFLGKDFRARRRAADWKRLRQSFDYADDSAALEGLVISLMGAHQCDNAALAAKGALILAKEYPGINEKSLRRGLFETRWPGRFDVRKFRGNTVIVDGAHNEEAAARLAEEYRASAFGSKRARLIFGAVREKNVSAMAKRLAPVASEVVACEPPTPRARKAADIKKIFAKFMDKRKISFCGSVFDALAEKTSLNVVVAGSLYLAGAALKIIGASAAGRKQ